MSFIRNPRAASRRTVLITAVAATVLSTLAAPAARA